MAIVRRGQLEPFRIRGVGLVNVAEIYWIEFPSGGGRAQAGRRPAIIAQKYQELPTVLAIPLTTQQDALRFAGTVLIERDPVNNLSQLSVALVFQLTTIDKKFVKDKLGEISNAKMAAIWAAFDALTGRDSIDY